MNTNMNEKRINKKKRLQALNDAELLICTKKLVKREQELIAEVIEHLEEIEKRRLYSDLGYKSLYEYCTIELKYSQDQAYRRIQAMKITRQIPEVKEMISNGELSLTTLNVATSFMNEAKIDDVKKKAEFLNDCKNLTKTEVQDLIFEMKNEMDIPQDRPQKDQIVHINKNESRIHVTIQNELLEKIEKIKGLIAHKKRNMKLEELIELMADEMIRKLEKDKFSVKSTNEKVDKKIDKKIESKTEMNVEKKVEKNFEKNELNSKNIKNTNDRYIRAVTKRELYLKSGGKCEVCGSTYALEIDHIKPIGIGGKNSTPNCRILCRNCNQRKAIKTYGQKKMDQYRFW